MQHFSLATPLRVELLPKSWIVKHGAIIWKAQSDSKRRRLPVNLPKAATAESQTHSTRVTVTIDKQGNLALNRQPIGLDALEGQVQKLVGEKELLVNL